MDQDKLITELKAVRVNLILEKAEIEKKLQGIEHALASLSDTQAGTVNSETAKTKKTNADSSLSILIEQQTEILNSLVQRIESLENSKTAKTDFHIPIAGDDYPVNGTIAKKIIYALSHIGPSTAKTIASYIVSCEPALSITKVHNTVTMMAWTLAKDGDIHSEKEGNKNVYSIKSKKKQAPLRSVG